MLDPQIARAEVAVAKLFPRLDAEGERVARTLYRLLARGHPVTAEVLADAASADVDVVTAALNRWHGVHRDSSGAVTGFWGLALAATPHRLSIAGRTLNAWCAWDTLFLPALLESTAEVESICPATGAQLRFVVAPSGVREAPSGAVMSFVTPEHAQVQADVVRHFCRFVHFFAASDGAREWLERHPGTFAVSLAEAWRLARVKLSAQYPSMGSALSPEASADTRR
jgi:alkylmercury lyase